MNLLRTRAGRIFALSVSAAIACTFTAVPAHAADTSQAYFGGLRLVPSQDGLPADMVTLMGNVLDPDSTPEDVPPGGTSKKGRYSQPFAFGGVLLDPAGAPIAGAQLQASLVPGSKLMTDNKDDAEVLPIQTVTTDSTGHWNIDVPALKQRYVGDYVQDDGGIDVSFTSFGSDYALLAELSMMPPMSSDSEPYAMVEDDDMLDPDEIAMAQSMIDQGYSLPGTGIVVNNLTLRAVEGQVTDPNHDLPTADQPEPDYNPATVCSENFAGNMGDYKYTWGTTNFFAWVPIQRLQTRSYTTEYYNWISTKSTQTQYGINLSYEGVTAIGSYTHSATSSYGDSKTYGHNLIQQQERGWNYRFYYLKCYVGGSTGWADAGVKELRPYKYTGDIRDVSYYGFTCNYKSTVAAGHAPENSNVGSYTRVGGVSVGGFSLNSTMANGTQSSKKWNISTTHSAILCGENDYYPYTARSMEASS